MILTDEKLLLNSLFSRNPFLRVFNNSLGLLFCDNEYVLRKSISLEIKSIIQKESPFKLI